MPTHDMIIANDTGAAVRADINLALAALGANSISAPAPATTYAGMFWCDTTAMLLKQRNTANSAWITIGVLDATNLGLLALTGGTMTGGFTPGQTTGIVGTTTNNNVQAGSVGEYVESIVLFASATALTTNTAKTVTSISLTAGDWDVIGNVAFTGGTTTNVTAFRNGISTVDNTLPTDYLYTIANQEVGGSTPFADAGYSGIAPARRLSLAGSPPVYFVGP